MEQNQTQKQETKVMGPGDLDKMAASVTPIKFKEFYEGIQEIEQMIQDLEPFSGDFSSVPEKLAYNEKFDEIGMKISKLYKRKDLPGLFNARLGTFSGVLLELQKAYVHIPGMKNTARETMEDTTKLIEFMREHFNENPLKAEDPV